MTRVGYWCTLCLRGVRDGSGEGGSATGCQWWKIGHIPSGRGGWCGR
ncbi:MAG: hypothetical protein ACFFAK_17335 [Promethearchaeota archaeon]